MILHHYEMSPFSEKIRLMFGYTEIPWQSAISPPNPPRPIVDPLLGGYRRIPVGQIGADLFCDTRIIAAEIANIAGKAELSFENSAPEIASFASKTNSETFMSVVQTGEPGSMLKMLVTRYWPWQIAALIKDRANVAKSSNVPRMKKKVMINKLDLFKTDMETMLSDKDCLFGDAPSIADFAAYHVIWFADLTRSVRFLNGFPKALAWQARMQGIGHGQSSKINKTQVFELAKNSKPRELGSQYLSQTSVGKTVTIRPTDYARDPVSGRLAGADDSRWIIAHQTQQFGTVHVHFPVHDYDLDVDE